MLDDWSRYYDENKQIYRYCIPGYKKKAFDTNPHGRLLLKLEKCGIQGSLLQWIKDFLHGTEQDRAFC